MTESKMRVTDVDSGLTAERLRALLDYNPATGMWTWVQSLGSRAQKGCQAGWVNDGGYRIIMVDRRKYRASRLAWLWMRGEWPANLIDHRDNDPSNDRWLNIRQATNLENQKNVRMHRDNASGLKGAYFDKRDRMWYSTIMRGGKKEYLGYFGSALEAHAAYAAASAKLHGEFGRVG
jgi:hypothetical protein